MPTGYTAPVQSGEVRDFPTFATQCARAFGALITMRDDPTDTPIPEEFEVSDYHPNALKDAEARLVGLSEMTVAEITAARLEAFESAVAYRDEFLSRKQAERVRYEAMLEKVRAWTPPTDEHQGLRDFMEEQLSGSIDVDCGDYEPSIDVPTTNVEWMRAEVEKAKKSVEYHRRELVAEEERVAGRNEWVRALRESLEGEED